MSLNKLCTLLLLQELLITPLYAHQSPISDNQFMSLDAKSDKLSAVDE